jgi:hypothetical protein
MAAKRFDVKDYRPAKPKRAGKPKEKYIPGTARYQFIQESKGQLRLF